MAINIDFNSPEFETQIAKLDKSKTYYVYCLSGGRSGQAAKWMRDHSFSKVFELKGGILAWQNEKLPLSTAGDPSNISDELPLIVSFIISPVCGILKPLFKIKLNLAIVSSHQNFRFYEADIRSPSECKDACNSVDWVFHLAGLADIVPSIEMPEQYFSTNVTGTFNMLQLAKEAGVKKFLYAASSSSYGIPDLYPTSESSVINPQYPYALTKYMGEELVIHWARVYKMPSISLRLFNVYGTRSRTTGAYGAVFGVFLAQKLNKKPLHNIGSKCLFILLLLILIVIIVLMIT